MKPFKNVFGKGKGKKARNKILYKQKKPKQPKSVNYTVKKVKKPKDEYIDIDIPIDIPIISELEHLDISKHVVPKTKIDTTPIEETKFCSICYDDLDSKNMITLDCNHSFDKGCLDKWGTYDEGDFIRESKHVCPECRKGKILLNSQYPPHYHIMDSETKWLKDKYQVEGKNLEKKDIIIYRFCKKCNVPFEVGPMDCGMDEQQAKEHCMRCDPLARVRHCPICNIAIMWISGCQRVYCTSCRNHFCFIHLRTEEYIRDELLKLFDKDPYNILDMYEGSYYGRMTKAWVDQTLLGNGTYIYNCVECAYNKCLYGMGISFNNMLHMDQFKKYQKPIPNEEIGTVV